MTSLDQFQRNSKTGSAPKKTGLICRSVVAVILLGLATATAEARSVPLPREKPIAPERADDEAKPIAPERADDEEKPVAPERAADELSSQCLRGLEETGVIADIATGFVSRGQCTFGNPVAMEAVDTRIGRLTMPARPILECQFAAILGAWLGEVVSPIAASLLGSPVESVVTGPGYQCRSRSGGKLSEHALGNAIDISGFRLADDRIISVQRWAEAEGAEHEFLRAISASACGYFTTVLGPGSDAAHADHLHVDHAERRTAEFRICMPR